MNIFCILLKINNKQSNMYQYKNCFFNCLSISHHRYLYAKMNTKPATKIGIPIKKVQKLIGKYMINFGKILNYVENKKIRK